MQKTLIPLRQTAAEVLAAAVSQVFPAAQLVRGEGTVSYFFYDFRFPFVFQKEMLTLLEERMRIFLKEKPEIRVMEMVPANAAALLMHRGRPEIAKGVREISRASVQICQIGDFVDYCPYPFETNWSSPCFKLLEGYPLGGGVTRIVGAIAEDKQELKEISRRSAFQENTWQTLAIKRGLFREVEGTWVWEGKGEALREKLIQRWRREHLKQGFVLVAAPDFSLLKGGERLAQIGWVPLEEGGREGILAPDVATLDRAQIHPSEGNLLQECISSLQFIVKMPKILDFEFEIVLSISRRKGSGVNVLKEALERAGLVYKTEREVQEDVEAMVSVRIADSLGRKWAGPYLSLLEGGKTLIRSMYGPLERWVALLLERTGGQDAVWAEYLEEVESENQ
ncbi:MAG: hypothetical protein JSS61_01655 [Verrucomicrobia bacterium]|nr:hypothetical protein [Verrucomicrobiota bacterium]